MTVRSNQLGASPLSGTTAVTLYTTPANTRTIVKSIIIRNTSGGAITGAVAVKNGATTKASMATPLAATNSAGDTAYLAPWLVLLPSDVLIVQLSGGTGFVIASGAELAL